MSELIERSVAIDAICELHIFGKDAVFGEYNENSYAEHLHDAVKAVEEVEAVDAVPVAHGRWIRVVDNNGQHQVCEFCGEWKYHINQKFCGECGARLDGKDEA